MIEWVLLVYLVGTHEPLLAHPERPERVYPTQHQCSLDAAVETVPGKTYGFCKPRQGATR